MRTGILVLNFGEPEDPVEEQVIPFLERIFLRNASLEEDPPGATASTRSTASTASTARPGAPASPGAPNTGAHARALERSRELARRRAPGLIEEYRSIGGSPLNAQARAQAEALEAELRRRGMDARSYTGMQFTAPSVADAVAEAREDGMERLVALPVYPLCGPSTTVAALEDVHAALDDLGWEVEVLEISGWHRHPDYTALHAENVRDFLAERGVSLDDPDTRLVFSAHGTPIKYLDEGSRYDVYVEELCAALAGALGVDDPLTGFQNHENRDVEWTRPAVDDVIRGLGGGRAVVVAVSFMHEQSETLAELDGELAEEAAEAGVEMHRVPVPHGSSRFVGVLADLVEARLGRELAGADLRLGPCRCRPHPSTRCLNGGPAPV